MNILRWGEARTWTVYPSEFPLQYNKCSNLDEKKDRVQNEGGQKRSAGIAVAVCLTWCNGRHV